MQLIDTHCHIHDQEFAEKFEQTAAEIILEAKEAHVEKLICVGTDIRSSKEAVVLAEKQENCFATVALHPHEAEKLSVTEIELQMKELDALLAQHGNIVAIGECGLDYFYHESHDVIERQQLLFKLHIELAQKYNLPMVFHVRQAFPDFFAILDSYEGIRGVVHSFTSNEKDMKECIKRGLFIGLNGIMTFTRDDQQLQAAKNIPLEKLLLETDAPFLTPAPFRGTMCKPKHIVQTAAFLSELRGENLDDLAERTTKNAMELFKL